MATSDVTAYTAAMRQVWGCADYGALADRLAVAGRQLIRDSAPAASEQVLDLAAGTGNVAALARERDAAVTAVDLSPRMVELGRARTGGSGVVWFEADAERLPFPDGSFDTVLSCFGVIFAPRPSVALEQARRVLSSGGRLALTCWTPDGFMGRMTETVRAHTGVTPGIADVLDWGRPEVLTDWLSAAGFTEPRIRRCTLPWHFDSPAAMTHFFRVHSPAHAAAAAGLGERAAAMFADIERLAGPDGEPVRAEAEYLVVIAHATA